MAKLFVIFYIYDDYSGDKQKPCSVSMSTSFPRDGWFVCVFGLGDFACVGMCVTGQGEKLIRERYHSERNQAGYNIHSRHTLNLFRSFIPSLPLSINSSTSTSHTTNQLCCGRRCVTLWVSLVYSDSSKGRREFCPRRRGQRGVRQGWGNRYKESFSREQHKRRMKWWGWEREAEAKKCEKGRYVEARIWG